MKFEQYLNVTFDETPPPTITSPLEDDDLVEEEAMSRMELYMQNREHGRMILELVENGPLIWPTIEENGVTRTKKYVELSVAKKIQDDCDIKATNIILQGLPADIYSLVNHHRVAKDLWERVHLLDQENGSNFKGRQGQSYSGTGFKGNATSYGGNNASGQARDVKCYNRQGEGHMARQYTQPKQPRNVTEDLDTYDSDCDDISNAKVVLMANISNYGSDIILEQAFWLRMSNPTNKPCDASPVKIKAPKELPKVSLVNESLKKLKFHLVRFNNVVKIRTIPDARTEGEWGFEHTKAVFNNEIIPFLKSLKDIFNVFDRDILNEIMEVQTVAAVQQSSVDKQCLEIAKKELLLENDRLLQQIMSQDVLLTVMNSMSLIDESVNVERKQNESCDKCFNLEAELLKSQNAFNVILKSYSQLEKHSQLQDKDSTICKLKDIIKSMREKSKEENVKYDYCEIETKNMKLENSVATLLSENKHLCNEITHVKQEAPIDYLKYTQKKADLLSGIVEQAKAEQPLDKDAKKVAVTPKNKVKKVRFAEPLTSSSNIKQVESLKTLNSNTSVLSSTGLKCYTSKCGSKPTGNKRNDRISQTPSRNMKNKVEAQPRKVNKKNCVVEPICDVDVKHSLLNANSEPICATCKKSMFDGVHDICLLDFVENMNSHVKSAKKHKKQNIWKPTGHVFTKVGLNWNLTCRTFTIVDISSSSSFVMTGTVRFGNDNIARIMGYGDYQLGNVTISRVYYVEGLGHNLFFVGQFCDADLEVAFRKETMMKTPSNTSRISHLLSTFSNLMECQSTRLNIADLKPTRMCIKLANKTTQFPKGIAENIMVKIDKFVFPVDFVILDMEEDHRIPIILGRPFLATAHAMIDVFNKKISFEVGDEIITFYLEKSMKFPPSNEDTYHAADIIDLSVISNMKEILPQDHDNLIEPILYQLPKIHEDDDNPTLFTANSIDDEKPTPKLKELDSHLEYAFLDNNCELPVIISSLLSDQEKMLLLEVLTKHKKALAWKISDIKGISPSFCTHKILMEENSKPTVQPQYGFSGYFQIPLAPEDQEKTMFTCPYGTFACRRMPFGLCNAPATFQRCMTTIFHDMCKDFMEVFMDDFSVFGNSFRTCLNNLSKMIARCEETKLVLNWEKCHFMVKEGIVLGHKISKAGIEVDKAKVDVIASLPYPTNIKGIQSFLGHAGFYRKFIKDFSKIARPMTQLLMKDAKFDFSDECIKSFDILRDKLITAPVIIAPNWDLDFELMCDASDYAVGAVLGQWIEKKFRLIYYAMVYTDHSALKYLFSKQDVKPILIRWVLLLWEFTIEIKDKKGTENLAADHLSRLENPGLEELSEDTIQDNFPDEHLKSKYFKKKT
ncbi:reverse transcriptase domain-containing protein [Tanacetum coccineum]|uniref:Reverse transcriptase domain-containing protein n=1 Tax=Tanacetum coccineum TaxID=301880 RepID=A0ABQ4Y0U3_9ASTR